SHDGKRISSTLGGHPTLPTVELLDFDYNTGQVSNPMVLADNNQVGTAYSSEFSPDDQLLYLSNHTESTVYQYDLTAGGSGAIRASRVPVGSSSVSNMSYYELGPDGRIYITGYGATFLAVIQYPNLRGVACGFKLDGVFL